MKFFISFIISLKILCSIFQSYSPCSQVLSDATISIAIQFCILKKKNKQNIVSNLCCVYTLSCLDFHWSVASLPGATRDCSWRKLIVPILAAINSQYLLGYDWEFMPTSSLHAEILSDLRLHKSYECCHNHCEFIYTTSLLCQEKYCFLVVIHRLWLLLHFYCFWAPEGGRVL